jgi:hypothetical protein
MFLQIPTRETVPKVPHYLQVRAWTTTDYVQQYLPPGLQGTAGVIQMIAAYIGSCQWWVQILGPLERLHQRKTEDAYFIYWLFANILPLPHSLSSLSRPGTTVGPQRSHCIEVGSRLIPWDAGATQERLYYIRSGHMGTATDLKSHIYTVSCRGYMTNRQPILSGIRGRHLVITDTIGCWKHTHNNTIVCTPQQIHNLDPTTRWDTVILDHINPEIYDGQLTGRYIHGRISPSLVRLNALCKHRHHTILYNEWIPEYNRLFNTLFLLHTTYKREKLIAPEFTIALHTVRRVVETLLVSGTIHREFNM